MLICYMDDSTSSGEADPSTCVAGYVANGKQWAVFERAWNRMMKHYGVEVLHTTELETEQARAHSPYRKWSRKKVREFQSDIQGIIVGSGIKDLGYAIPLSVYSAVMTPKRLKTFGKTPDGLCALLTMLAAGGYAWAQKGAYKQAPSFVYERGGRYDGMLKWAHHWLTTSSIYRDFYYLSTLTAAPKSKEFPQLQAADYLAFNISKRTSHIVDPNPPANAILETLPDGRRVRQTRYPLLALYSNNEGDVHYAPTPEHLEEVLQLLEADKPTRGRAINTQLP